MESGADVGFQKCIKNLKVCFRKLHHEFTIPIVI